MNDSRFRGQTVRKLLNNFVICSMQFKIAFIKRKVNLIFTLKLNTVSSVGLV